MIELTEKQMRIHKTLCSLGQATAADIAHRLGEGRAQGVGKILSYLERYGYARRLESIAVTRNDGSIVQTTNWAPGMLSDSDTCIVQPIPPKPPVMPVVKPLDPVVSELYEKLDCLMDIDKLIRKVLVMHEETLALREELNRTIAKIKELP